MLVFVNTQMLPGQTLRLIIMQYLSIAPVEHELYLSGVQ